MHRQVEAGRVHCAGHILFARGDDALDPVDHQLRGEDARRTPARRIIALQVRIGLGPEGVGPADIVPVVDVIGQRHIIGLAAHPGQQRIGLGAGRAALRGEQFEHGFGMAADFAGRGRQQRRREQGSGDQDRWEAHDDLLGTPVAAKRVKLMCDTVIRQRHPPVRIMARRRPCRGRKRKRAPGGALAHRVRGPVQAASETRLRST